MKINQVYSTVNSIAKQMWGENAITVVDARGIISMGQNVLSSVTERDKFLNILADRIGITILRTLDLELDFPNLLKHSYEWGAIISKINIQPFEAKQQKAWDVGTDGFTPNQFDIDKPNVTQTFFKDANAFEFDVTIPDRMLKTAFVSAEEFGTFIDGIMESISDSMTMALNNMSYVAIDNFIAEKVKADNGVINVLTGFNTQAGTSYSTLQEALDDKEFYRYTSMIIRNIMKYMGKASKLYNTGGMVRATARDNMHVILSSDVMSGMTSYLSADTFHDELVAIKGYVEFVSLQGTGNSGIPTVANNTKITVVPASNAEDDSTAVTVNGVIGLICDREAIAIGYDDMFNAVDRNNRNRYTNYTYGCTRQWLNDLSENGVVLVAYTE